MGAMKCDRCGKLYEHYAGAKQFRDGERANALILIDRDMDKKYWTRSDYDFCPECMEGLEAFIHDGAISVNGK